MSNLFPATRELSLVETARRAAISGRKLADSPNPLCHKDLAGYPRGVDDADYTLTDGVGSCEELPSQARRRRINYIDRGSEEDEHVEETAKVPDYLPEKHHFIPAFAQQPWTTGGDKKVCEMRRVNGKVHHRRAHPNATGYKHRLYSTNGVPEDQAQYLELNLFSPLDHKADLALKRILAMESAPLSNELRHAWTRYLMSLLYRDPETVALIKEHSATMWREALAVLEADYDSRRRPTDPPDFSGFVALTHPAAPQMGASNFLATIINSERVGRDIATMNWSVIRPVARAGLLLSDKPLIRPFGLGDPDGLIMTPIGPDAIFLASNDPDAGRRVSMMDPDWLCNEVNLAVVSQAVEFVWGADNSQIDFVREHFGTSPLPPVITDEQRARAVSAARGEIGR